MKKGSGFLAAVERIGNKMPHPIALFLGIILIVLCLSLLLSLAGVSAVHPQTQETLYVKNLLNVRELIEWGSNLSKNLQNFPVLASVLILAAATGLCEQTGFFASAIKSSLKNATGSGVVFVIALVGACGNIAGDVAFLIVPTIAASVFLGTGRHPLVGLFLGYAAVGGGYGTNFIPGGWDVILTPITIQSAKLLDPAFDMNLVSGYYMMAVGTVLVALTATFVTVKFIEPKFGKYEGSYAATEENEGALTEVQQGALR
jgi:aminobenzoyl-glutamate transport protein